MMSRQPAAALRALAGSRWAGRFELWLDPLGDEASRGECAIDVEERAIRYRWSRDGQPHHGFVTLHGAGGDFTDTWHQPEPMRCELVPGHRGLFCVVGTYNRDWGWRIQLSLRAPTDELVLQMTNIAPWGEEARAVRMVCSRTSA